MKRFFIAVVIFVVALNVGIFVYSEFRARRTVAETTARTTELEKQTNISHVTMVSESSQGMSQASSVTEYVPISEEDRTEYYKELKFEEECRAEDNKETYLSWEQRVRNDLTKRHGAIPEIDRYIELATVCRDGGNLTVVEVVEEIELRVMLYGVGHEELADTIEMAKNYPPDAIVRVKRESNENSSADSQPSDGTTTSTEYVRTGN